MFKMPYTGSYHTYIFLVAHINRKFIVNGAARLQYGGDTGIGSNLYAIGKRKNASEAITAPFTSKPNSFALTRACFKASTREVCPTPLDSNWLFLVITMVFD